MNSISDAILFLLSMRKMAAIENNFIWKNFLQKIKKEW